MTIAYTPNFSFALLGTGSANWGAVTNAMLESVDLEVKAAQTPIIDRSGNIIVSLLRGQVILKKYNH